MREQKRKCVEAEGDSNKMNGWEGQQDTDVGLGPPPNTAHLD